MKEVETFLTEAEVLWSESSQELTVLAMNLPAMDNGGSVHPMRDWGDEEMELSLEAQPEGNLTLIRAVLSSTQDVINHLCAKKMKRLLLHTMWIP